MRVVRLIALMLLVCTTGVLSAETGNVHVGPNVDYAIPGNSPVKFASLDKYHVGFFEGKFTLRGHYFYGYVANHEKREAHAEPELYFVPEKADSSKLPYWKQRGNVNEIRFQNDEQVVKALVSEESLIAISKGTVNSVNGSATVSVDNFQLSIDCDYPTYSVRFLEVVQPPILQTAQTFIEQYGC